MNYSIVFLLLASIVSALPVLSANQNVTDPEIKLPLEDSFYEAPKNLSAYKNGEIFRSRQIQPNITLRSYLADQVFQVAYRTEDAHGNASHSIATVFKPPVPLKKPRLFSYQFWEDSAELNCSPSYTLLKGKASPDGVTGGTDAPLAFEFALNNGWYVVVPDHEGPKSGFLEGYTQGRNGLDGIKAALNHLELKQDTPTVLYGYSGGASATVWMTNLHESHAPELNIVGAAHGGTPVDIKATVEWLDRKERASSGFVVGAFAGLLNTLPDLNETVWPHLNDTLKEAVLTLKKPGNCIVTEVTQFAFQEFHNQMDVDFYTYKPFVDLMRHESLLKNMSSGTLSTPKFPRFIFHADGDETIPFSAIEQYVQEQCASGANIEWVPWSSNDHSFVENAGLPAALQFLYQSFENRTAHVKCGTSSNSSYTEPSLNIILGQTLKNIMTSL